MTERFNERLTERLTKRITERLTITQLNISYRYLVYVCFDCIVVWSLFDGVLVVVKCF